MTAGGGSPVVARRYSKCQEVRPLDDLVERSALAEPPQKQKSVELLERPAEVGRRESEEEGREAARLIRCQATELQRPVDQSRRFVRAGRGLGRFPARPLWVRPLAAGRPRSVRGRLRARPR